VLIVGLVGLFVARWSGEPSARRHHARPNQGIWRSARNSSLVGLLIGLTLSLGIVVAFFVFALNSGNSSPLYDTLFYWENGWLLAVLGACLGGGLFFKLEAEIRPTEVLTWAWRRLQRQIVLCLLAGLVFGLLLALVDVLFSTGYWDLGNLLLFPSAFGLVVALIGLLMAGWSGELSVRRSDAKPNQGIWRSARNSGRVGLIVGLVISLSAGLVFWLSDWLLNQVPLEIDLISGLGIGLIAGLSAGLTVGMLNGGVACIQHSMLRLLLWATKSSPGRYTRFLDDAAERILLRRVGGGYIFAHRLLQDYFAALNTQPAAPQRNEQAFEKK